MDGTPDPSTTAPSPELKEVALPVKEEEHVTQSGGDHCSHCKSCLYEALRAISLDQLVNREIGSFGRRCALTPEARVIVANVRQFFAKLKDHLGPDARGTVFSSVIAVTATACAVRDSTVERVLKRARQQNSKRKSGGSVKKRKLDTGQKYVVADSEDAKISSFLQDPDMPP
ncbi:hypothetical protein COOONC_09915 [Cooperia oncophora]